jgi:hypothetical protein
MSIPFTVHQQLTTKYAYAQKTYVSCRLSYDYYLPMIRLSMLLTGLQFSSSGFNLSFLAGSFEQITHIPSLKPGVMTFRQSSRSNELSDSKCICPDPLAASVSAPFCSSCNQNCRSGVDSFNGRWIWHGRSKSQWGCKHRRKTSHQSRLGTRVKSMQVGNVRVKLVLRYNELWGSTRQ